MIDDAYGSKAGSQEYFANNRHSIEELYLSERHFLVPAFKDSDSVLDIGCAAGGSYLFSKEVNPDIEYAGLDISEDLIGIARKQHSQGTFSCFDGSTIPYENESFDTCFSIGVFHHLPHWKEMLLELLRVSKKRAIIDLRLTEQATLNDPGKFYQKIAFDEEWDGQTKVPYLVINKDEVLSFLSDFVDEGYSVKLFGYPQAPTSLAVLPYDKVYMTALCIEKNSESPHLNVDIKGR